MTFFTENFFCFVFKNVDLDPDTKPQLKAFFSLFSILFPKSSQHFKIRIQKTNKYVCRGIRICNTGTWHLTRRGAQFQVDNTVRGKVAYDVTRRLAHSPGVVGDSMHQGEHLADHDDEIDDEKIHVRRATSWRAKRPKNND
jgi:hypothetical protein